MQQSQHEANRWIVDKIMQWYQAHKRDLPWRHTQDPYLIWLSEVILQQTRVKQGLPYYERFVAAYPTVASLAAAPDESVMRLWQGLGYYSRARNMLATARHIVEQLGGIFPARYADLIQLKGIGKYTAAAIASFAFDEDVAVLDGNVYRVLARIFGIEEDIASPQAAKTFGSLAQALLPTGQAALYNQAMMEFGAVQCPPQKPLCLYCPIQQTCEAFRRSMQQELPVKKSKVKIRERFFYYAIFQSGEQIALRKRIGKDIWQGLYDFYLYETPTPASEEAVLAQFLPQQSIGEILQISTSYKHILTHQRIQAQFFQVRLANTQQLAAWADAGLQWVSLAEARDLPKPILIHNYLEKFFFNV